VCGCIEIKEKLTMGHAKRLRVERAKRKRERRWKPVDNYLQNQDGRGMREFYGAAVKFILFPTHWDEKAPATLHDSHANFIHMKGAFNVQGSSRMRDDKDPGVLLEQRAAMYHVAARLSKRRQRRKLLGRATYEMMLAVKRKLKAKDEKQRVTSMKDFAGALNSEFL
jgi:hypothetical protein